MRFDSDYLDGLADEWVAIEEAKLDLYRQEIRERVAKNYGVRVDSMNPNDPRRQLVKWIRTNGSVDNTIPLCGGQFRTVQYVTTVDDVEYYHKGGWWTYGGKTLSTLNPDDTVVKIVERMVADGRV
jgi:hypothetical protein